MTFKEIQVKTVDEKSPYFYPSRTIEIKTSEGRILTPTRAATFYEFNQKIAIPAITPIDNPISISVRKMNWKKLATFLKQNGLYKNWFRQILDSEDMMKYSSFRAHVIQPTTSKIILKNPNGTVQKDAKGKVKTEPSGVDYLADNPNLRERFVRLVLKMQLDADLDIITVPYMKFPISDYQQFITSITREIRSQNKEPLFIFDLDYQKRGDRFEDAMSFFIKKADIKLMAFGNKSFQSAPISYDVLSRYVTKDVAFFTFEIAREDKIREEGEEKVKDEISKMHYFPFIGNDVYSIKTPKYVPDPNKPKMEATKETIKFFNPTNLLIEHSSTRLKQPKKVLEEMKESGDKWLNDIIGDYHVIGNDEDKIKVINALSKVHELKTSTMEFVELQKRVRSGESTEYIKEKTYLESQLTKLRPKKRKS